VWWGEVYCYVEVWEEGSEGERIVRRTDIKMLRV
jgi:hypothetical protein